jgi:hypothetical protein
LLIKKGKPMYLTLTLPKPNKGMNEHQTLWSVILDIGKYLAMPIIAVIITTVWNTREKRKERKEDRAREAEAEIEKEKKASWKEMKDNVIDLKTSIQVMTNQMTVVLNKLTATDQKLEHVDAKVDRNHKEVLDKFDHWGNRVISLEQRHSTK